MKRIIYGLSIASILVACSDPIEPLEELRDRTTHNWNVDRHIIHDFHATNN